MKKPLLLIFIIALSSPLLGQTSRDLSRIRREIRQLEDQILNQRSRERDALNQLQDLDRQMGLRRTLIHEYEESATRKEASIQVVQRRLDSNISSYQKLKEQVVDRMVFLYKRGRLIEWEILLSLKNLNQFAVWMSYQKRIMDNDDRQLRLLVQKREKIEEDRNVLNRELRETRRLMEAKTGELRALSRARTLREEMLSQLREDRNLLQKRLEQKRAAFQAIQGQISEAESQRRAGASAGDGKAFQARRGKLGWPVSGSVVSKYGRYKDPVLKTEQENLGIEIKASERAMVKAVADGIVAWVSWQRGMGNIVLLDHGGGFYTVYAHLDVVFVDGNDRLGKGDAIGRVGDGRSMNGSNLHFEIWSGRNHMNPEKWLGK